MVETRQATARIAVFARLGRREFRTVHIDDTAIIRGTGIVHLIEIAGIAAGLGDRNQMGGVAERGKHLGIAAMAVWHLYRDAPVGLDDDIAGNIVVDHEGIAAAPARGIGLDIDGSCLQRRFIHTVFAVWRTLRVGLP